jgi:hypothetical protein
LLFTEPTSFFLQVQRLLNALHEQNMNFNFQPLSTLVFLVPYKHSPIESCSSFEDLSAYILWFHIDRCKFFVHLRSLNVRHFEMVSNYGIKNVWRRGPLRWNDLCTKRHNNIDGSKVIRYGQNADPINKI